MTDEEFLGTAAAGGGRSAFDSDDSTEGSGDEGYGAGVRAAASRTGPSASLRAGRVVALTPPSPRGQAGAGDAPEEARKLKLPAAYMAVRPKPAPSLYFPTLY
jgi:hypothetical protein